MSQSELARRTGRPVKTINEIVKGKTSITPETALQFERVLGISANFWNGAESNYRDYLTRRRDMHELQGQTQWLEGFPVSELVRRRLIPDCDTSADRVDALLRFFSVSSPRAWEKVWLSPNASYRRSKAFEASPHAVAAWLRWGEIKANTIAAPTFDEESFRRVLGQIPTLTRVDPIGQVVEQVRTMCQAAGVVVLVTPEFEGCRVSGAARWIDGKPVIQLSGRHKSDDHFWFTFFHEARHLLQPSGRRGFVDDFGADDTREEDPLELDADRFARDSLIPPLAYDEFVDIGSFDADSIRDFANREGVAAGIVVGRLQHDCKIGRAYLNHLKVPIRLAD